MFIISKQAKRHLRNSIAMAAMGCGRALVCAAAIPAAIAMASAFGTAATAQQVVQGDLSISSCPAGQAYGSDQGCYTEVNIFQISPSDTVGIDRVLAENGWRLATPGEVLEAWQKLGLNTSTFSKMSNGKYAAPSQADNGPGIKRGVNFREAGVAMFATGIFYVHARAPTPRIVFADATITQINPPNPVVTEQTPPPSRPSNGCPAGHMVSEVNGQLVCSGQIAISGAPNNSGPTYVNAGDPPPQQYFTDEAADRCADPGNFMLDGWNGPSRPVLEEAARALFPKLGWPDTPAAMGRMKLMLERNAEMRWEFAPYMLEAGWKAITTNSPTAAQAAFKNRFQVWAGCDKNLTARRNIVRWNQAMGRDIDSSINGISIQWIDPNPRYKPATLAVLNDTGPSIGSTGYDVTNDGNPMYIGSKGLDTVAKLYQPLAMVNASELSDLENLRLIRQEMPRFVYGGEMALTAGGVASLITSIGISQEAWRHVLTKSLTATLNSELVAKAVADTASDLLFSKAKLISESTGETYSTVLARLQARQADDIAAAAAKTVVSSIADDVVANTADDVAVKVAAAVADDLVDDLVSIGVRKAGTKAAQELAELSAKQLAVKFIGSAAGPILSGASFFASVFGEKLADIVKTNDYEAALLRDMKTYEPFDIAKFLGLNPTEAQKAPIFTLLVKMTIAEPADRNKLTLEVPGFICPLGRDYIAEGCRREVRFYEAPGLSLEQAKNIANGNGWTLASGADVILAWEAKMIDTFAYGQLADGRFAVPIQSNRGSITAGANVDVTGGNQGFFYYQDFVPASLASGGASYIQNAQDLDKFIIYENSFQANANITKPRNPFASWSFEKVGAHYRIGNSAQSAKSYVGTDLGMHTTAEDSKLLWKITKADETFYRIEAVSMPHRYLTLNTEGKLELDYIKSNEAGALWHIPAGL